MNTMPPQFKLATTVVIWLVVCAINIVMLIAQGTDFNWIFGIVTLAIAGGVTSSIMTGDKESKPFVDVKVNSDEGRGGKAKRGDDLAQMLSMLDDDDAYEVRQRIKQRLLGRVDEGGEELESFEHLLADRDRQKRK